MWLLTAGGALFAAFPDAYATTFSGFYLAVMLVLFGLIVRAVSFEFRAGDPSWGKLWDALLRGLAASGAAARRGGGQHLRRHPHGRRGRLRRRAPDRPHHAFHAADGAFGAGDVSGRRRLLAALKAPLPSLPSGPRRSSAPALQVIALALCAVVSVYALVLVGPEMDPNLGILRWLFAALVVVGLLASLVVGKTSGDDLKAFLAQSASMIALVALWPAPCSPCS